MKIALSFKFLTIIFIFMYCNEPKHEALISKDNYDTDLDAIYQKNLLSDTEYLTYLFMGPRWLMINAETNGVTLEKLRLTGYKPDSIRYYPEKCNDSICMNIETSILKDSLILVSILVSNSTNQSIRIANLEIASVLGSEIARIYYYETYEDKWIEPRSTDYLDEYYVPIEKDLFENKHLNGRFKSPLEQYKFIYNVIWGFNYVVRE